MRLLTPGRKFIQSPVLTGVCIQCEKEVIEPIGYPDKRNPGGHVVAQGLICHSLIQRDIRRFALHKQAESTIRSSRCDIGAPGQTIHLQRLFYTDQTDRHAMVSAQPVDNMLPYPFFRGEAHIFFSDCVENIVFLPVSLESVIERRKVKRREQPQL